MAARKKTPTNKARRSATSSSASKGGAARARAVHESFAAGNGPTGVGEGFDPYGADRDAGRTSTTTPPSGESEGHTGGGGDGGDGRRLHILFTDLRDNDRSAADGLRARRQLLETVERLQERALTDDEKAELASLTRILDGDPPLVVDRLFVATASFFGYDSLGPALAEHQAGKFTIPRRQLLNLLKLASVYGLLATDRVAVPRFVETSPDDARPTLTPSQSDPSFTSFSKAFFSAFGETQANWPMTKVVFDILRKEGDTPGDRPDIDQVSATELARVVRCLAKKGIKPDAPQIQRKVNECLDGIQNVGKERPFTQVDIDLPDLEEHADYAIVADNVRAIQPIYFAAMLEELKVFQVRDKLAELFQNGILPIGSGNGGDLLYEYWRDSAKRMTEAERRAFYGRTLGVPGGDDGGMPNREFNDLWMRFVSAVSSYVRQNTVDTLIRARVPGAISDQLVRKAGRDLAANLSLHGYGMVFWVARELQKDVQSVIDLLSDPDIRSAYGARDMWQVVDQVATLELGGARNSVKYRTLATSGAIVMAWLANNAPRLSGSNFGDPILSLAQIRNPPPLQPGKKATTDPRDYDLFNACEQWLAVTGTEEARVEEFAQPREAPMMTSKPIGIPAIAREMLDSAGVPAMGLGRYPH